MTRRFSPEGIPGPVSAACYQQRDGLDTPGEPRRVAMNEQIIADTGAAFVKAAADAKRLGFDTAEMHGAHGYLIDQFFRAGTNLRAERCGGLTIKDRSRW
tara:strand:- start:3440 stop:3739 length:300 start_codon:yes stop_codon:yes gene_type:complete